jgi:quinoprotein glucose dehydrogenase
MDTGLMQDRNAAGRMTGITQKRLSICPWPCMLPHMKWHGHLLSITMTWNVASAQDAMKLQGTEWANDSLLGSPVAISMDNQGRAYVTQTKRRKESELDIRSHTNWVTDTLSFESVADREAFYRKELSAENSERNKSWLKDRNEDGIADFRDLAVISETVYRIEDKAGKGVADSSEVFVDGLNDAMTGVAAGVMSYGDQVYLAAIPRIWKFSADRKIGAADPAKEILLEGFGVRIAYSGHDMHGLTMGPDGRIYWSIGDKGLNVTDANGVVHKKTSEGAVLRCEPDGSGYEIFAHGLRNPQEIAFDQWGNLFSVDNDADFKGERERIVYITERSDSGWRCNWQYRGSGYNPWMDEKLAVPQWQGQAAHITPPLANYLDGPSGFLYNPGTALGEAWKDTFFVTLFPGRKLAAFQLEPAGASFRMTNDRLAFTGPMMTGLSWGPDGAIYVADWNSASWDPHDKGKVWKLDVGDNDKHPQRPATQTLLREGMAKKSVAELAELLGHDDQRVRRDAQFALASRGETKILLEAAQNHKSLLARAHAIWGIGQIARKKPSAIAPLLPLVTDPQAEVRAQTAKVMGDAAYQEFASEIAALLKDAEPRVCYHAAIALAKTGTPAQLPAITQMLEQRAVEDVFLRHAGITALAGVAKNNPQALAGLREHKSATVRIAAVVALRRIGAAEVAIYLTDFDPLVLAETARAIHDDDSISPALPSLAEFLTTDSGAAPVIIRRAISANLRLGGTESARRLATYAALSTAPEAMRKEAIDSLITWLQPAPLDRVEGRHRPLTPRPASELQAALTNSAESLLNDASASIRQSTCELIKIAAFDKANPSLHRLAANPKEHAAVRAAALRTLASLKDPDLARATESALSANDASLRNAALQLLARSGGASEKVVPLLEKVLEKGKAAEMQDAFATLGSINSPAARKTLLTWMKKLPANTVPEAARLDLLEAARAHNDTSLNAALDAYENSKHAGDKLAAFRETLNGGNAENGKHLALEHLAAQCTRCHKIGGDGAEVGPDLSKIGKQMNREQLLEALVLPNATIAKGYDIIMITLKDGKTLSGSVEKENATELQLRGADKSLTTLRIDQITNRTVPQSMMPPMDALLTKRELRDVIEYLAALK